LVGWLVGTPVPVNLRISSGLESPDSINLHKHIVKHIEGETRWGPWGRGVKTQGVTRTFVVSVVEAVVGRGRGKTTLYVDGENLIK
jgi:hypothetical protein